MHTPDNYRWSGELQRTQRINDMLKAEDRGVGEGFLENGKMWSVSMDLSPGRAGEGRGRWGGARVSFIIQDHILFSFFGKEANV